MHEHALSFESMNSTWATEKTIGLQWAFRKNSQTEKGPLFIQPGTPVTEGSNPTDRKKDGTPRSGGMVPVGEHPLPRTNPFILQHALWMTREGYKRSTIKSAIKTRLHRCRIYW
jgi:hypothetical protein